MSVGTFLLIVIGVVAVLFILDLVFAGGAMTMGTMHGMAMMMGNPIGLTILLVLLTILAVLVYAVFFR